VAIIENIRLLKGAGVLAERKAGTPSLALKQYNLFYGFNGSGKSTLSRIFAALEQGKEQKRLPEACAFEIETSDGERFAYPKSFTGLEKRVCVFNNDFIDENLRWDMGVASPIFYIGNDQAEAAKQLKALEASLPASSLKCESETKVLKEREKAFNDYKKLLARTVSTNLRQAARYEASQFIADFDKFNALDARLSDADLDAAIATCARSEPPAKVSPVKIPVQALLEIVESAAELAPKSIGSVVVNGLDAHPLMVQWVGEGHRYHTAHDLNSCLYCGNAVAESRKEMLTAAFDEKLSDYTRAINTAVRHAGDCIEAVAIARAAIPAAAQLSAEFQPPFEAAAVDLMAALGEIEPVLLAALDALKERKAAPTEPVTPVLPPLDAVKADIDRLEECCKAVNAVCQQHANMVDDFKAHQSRAREAIRRHYVAINKAEYTAQVDQISEAVSRQESAGAEFKKLEDDITSLRAIVQQHGPAAEKINALIKSYLGHSELTIVAVNEGYELHRHATLVTGTPSEGEKTAIALCYFLSTLEAEDRKIKDLIVVIDDPISSLDTKAMNYACSLIRNRLAGASQLIVLTHNQHCMNEFKKFWKGWTKGESAKATLKFIDVSIPAATMTRSSNIVDLPRHLREYESEYHYLCEKVIAYEAAGGGHFDYAFMMPNVLRRVLEIFTAFKVPRNGNLNDKLKTLCERHNTLDQGRLQALERLSQIESHSDNLDDLIGQSSLTVEESWDANAALLHLMETVDQPHADDIRHYCRP
jgi:wobble nucleotide-excising tRNase